jgi:hypothetical protein
MSDYNRCKICGKYDWVDKHTCPPSWKVQVVDYHGEEEWKDVYAHSPEAAAQDMAEQYDVDDYTLLEGETIVVRVQVDEDVVEYDCGGEAVPQYWAHKKEKTSEDQ